MSSPTISATASGLKARLQGIAHALNLHGDELQEDQTHISDIKADKDGVMLLNSQLNDFQIHFSSDLNSFEQEFNTQVNLQRGENQKTQLILNQLKADKTAVHQQLLAIQRRVEEIEEELGQE